MKINPISNVSPRMYNQKTKIKHQNPETNQSNVNFGGKFGAWVGGISGGGALIAAVVTCAVAPAAICLLGAATIAGAIGGSEIEDKVNNEDKDEENDP